MLGVFSDRVPGGLGVEIAFDVAGCPGAVCGCAQADPRTKAKPVKAVARVIVRIFTVTSRSVFETIRRPATERARTLDLLCLTIIKERGG